MVQSWVSVLALLMGFVVGGTMILTVGADPLQTYAAMFYGAFGNVRALGRMSEHFAPLLLTGLGTVVAFKAGLWNIGGEGQLYVGALTAVALGIIPMPPYIHLPVVILGASVAGAAYAALAAALYRRANVDLIVSTLMLNFIAFFLVFALTRIPPLTNPAVKGGRNTLPVLDSARFPVLAEGTTLNGEIIMALVAVIGVYLLVYRTRVGFSIRLLGGNMKAAEFAGVSIGKISVLSMGVSGALSALAGVAFINGSEGFLLPGTSRSYGYVGIGVALLAGLHPIVSIPSAILFAGLAAGGIEMQRIVQLPTPLVTAIAGTIVVVVLVKGYIREIVGVSKVGSAS